MKRTVGPFDSPGTDGQFKRPRIVPTISQNTAPVEDIEHDLGDSSNAEYGIFPGLFVLKDFTNIRLLE